MGAGAGALASVVGAEARAEGAGASPACVLANWGVRGGGTGATAVGTDTSAVGTGAGAGVGAVGAESGTVGLEMVLWVLVQTCAEGA